MYPGIRVDESFDICVYFCFMLKELGDLTDNSVSEIVISLETVNYFELMSEVERMKKKEFIKVVTSKNDEERKYSLLPGGRELADEFFNNIPFSIREKTIEEGGKILERIEREKAIKCYINYDYNKRRYDLCVKLLNELNGDTILDVRLFAPDEKTAKDMKKRFLAHPTEIISDTMSLFLKDRNYK